MSDTTEFPPPVGGPYSYAPAPTDPPTPKRSKKHLIGYPATALIALLIGSAAGGGTTPAPTAAPSPVTATVTATVAQPGAETTVEVPGPTVTKTVAAAPAAPPAPVTTFGEGDYTVGIDIPAGRYTTVESVGDTCYWGIYKAGTNHESIISNDIVSGGFPKVTLKKGQDFSSTRCGDWKKIG